MTYPPTTMAGTTFGSYLIGLRMLMGFAQGMLRGGITAMRIAPEQKVPPSPPSRGHAIARFARRSVHGGAPTRVVRAAPKACTVSPARLPAPPPPSPVCRPPSAPPALVPKCRSTRAFAGGWRLAVGVISAALGVNLTLMLPMVRSAALGPAGARASGRAERC